MRRPIAIAALGALCLIAVPASAGAATVEPQVERRAPARYPENLPGCQPRCVRGRQIPRGWVLLSRVVRLEAGERRTPVVFRCPGGRRFRTFGFLESGQIVMQIPDSQLPYTRRTRVRLSGERLLTPRNRPATGTLYAVCIPS
ncbi:MAG: hypothetical protein AVDCRST_MAG85-4124 [uncultured Solirubrobacteraceae bacterium]|uniref:Uncharacterized protein n=1 Tax=uncultured Solirubrobacteraceae bacterium TaxID=1162706 RepID=A0A6J4TZG5_9ACTN|nr:MAG: hypothetical protein AVDCRST_MAG85-4124 [uncultured Solirubrobacteraceae bacterium]